MDLAQVSTNDLLIEIRRRIDDGSINTLPVSIKEELPELYLEAYKLYPGNKSKKSDWITMKNKYRGEINEILPKLVQAINDEIVQKSILTVHGRFTPEWKNFKTWLNNRCWEQNLSLPADLSMDESNKKVPF